MRGRKLTAIVAVFLLLGAFGVSLNVTPVDADVTCARYEWWPSYPLSEEIPYIDKTLESLNALEYTTKNPHELALFMLAKKFLGKTIQGEELDYMLEYLNDTQDGEGAWSGEWTRMFTTHRVLYACLYYNALNFQRNLDPFFSHYATARGAASYVANEVHTDLRDIYHIVMGWAIYYRSYPVWLNTFFQEAEANLEWTSGPDSHKRAHILYTYVFYRRVWPNLDGIVQAVLNEQHSDGSWRGSKPTDNALYYTVMQLELLHQVLRLYPNYRTASITSATKKAASYVRSCYSRLDYKGTTYGVFRDPVSGVGPNLWQMLMGIMAASMSGQLALRFDPAFDTIVNRIQH